MTSLKYIIILVLLAAGFSPTVRAQSTALRPYEGALHTYSCNGISTGANFEFYITANADGSGRYDDGLTSEFDIIDSNGVVGGDGLASTQIQWDTGASEHIYFVWLEATVTGGCSNRISIQISPQASQFDLMSENVPADHTVSCPSISSSDGFNALASTYDAGSTTLQFKIKRVNGTDNQSTPGTDDTYDWLFEPVLSVNPEWNMGISIVSVAGANSGIITANTDRIYTVAGTDNEVTVTVAIKNLPGTVQDIKLKIQNQSESQTNLKDRNPENDVVTHRIEIMPVIEGMNGV